MVKSVSTLNKSSELPDWHHSRSTAFHKLDVAGSNITFIHPGVFFLKIRERYFLRQDSDQGIIVHWLSIQNIIQYVYERCSMNKLDVPTTQ